MPLGRSRARCRGPAARGMRHLFRTEFAQGELGIQVKRNPSSLRCTREPRPLTALHHGSPTLLTMLYHGAPSSQAGPQGPPRTGWTYKNGNKTRALPPKDDPHLQLWALVQCLVAGGRESSHGQAQPGGLGPTGATASCPPEHTPALRGAWTQTSLPAAPRPVHPSPAKPLQARQAGVPGSCRAPGAG